MTNSEEKGNAGNEEKRLAMRLRRGWEALHPPQKLELSGAQATARDRRGDFGMSTYSLSILSLSFLFFFFMIFEFFFN